MSNIAVRKYNVLYTHQKSRMYRVKELYESGLSKVEIAKMLKISLSTVYCDLHKLSVPIPKGLPTEILLKTKKMYESGMTIQQIADVEGITRQAVSSRLARIDVKTRSYRVELPIEQIVARYLGGESSNALAKAYNVSQATIRHRLMEQNITLRQNGSSKSSPMLDVQDPQESSEESTQHPDDQS